MSRIVKYKESLETANNEGQDTKIRRMGRIVKQYEEAIVANKKGAKYDYEELPAPPGYPPLPLTDNKPLVQVVITFLYTIHNGALIISYRLKEYSV